MLALSPLHIREDRIAIIAKVVPLTTDSLYDPKYGQPSVECDTDGPEDVKK
jgi:hypothetical protein